MGEAAAHYDGDRFNRSFAPYAAWDEAMVYGCVCDPGYGGYDCSQQECPLGSDPRSGAQVPPPPSLGQR
jgi:hypothetical protein